MINTLACIRAMHRLRLFSAFPKKPLAAMPVPVPKIQKGFIHSRLPRHLV